MSGRRASGQLHQETSPGVERRLDELGELLAQQLEWAQRGNLGAVEEACKQAERCVQTMAANCVLDDANLEGRRSRLESMYKRLCLILVAQREETSEVLDTIRRGKKVLRTYGNHKMWP